MTQEELLQAASELPPEELNQFITQITALQQRQQMAHEIEAPLLATIQTQLPTITQTRLTTLSEKREAETLSETEYAELIGLTEQIEDFNLQRVQALAELAKLRNVDLPTLMQQINFPHPAHV